MVRRLSIAFAASLALLPSANEAQTPPASRAEEELTLCAQMTYGPEGYASRLLRPRVSARLERAGPGRVRVELAHRGYRFALLGSVRGNDVVLDANQPCTVSALRTPDFCALPPARCDGTPPPAACEGAALGDGTFTLVQGTLTRSQRRLSLVGTVNVDACLLVRGRNEDRPIRVERAVLALTRCP